MLSSPARILLLFVLFLKFIFPVAGQENVSSKTLKSFEKAKDYFHKGDWYGCETELHNTLKLDSTFAEAYLLLGDVMLETGNPSEAVDLYKKALFFNPEREDIVLSLLANTLFSLSRYAESVIFFDRLVAWPGLKDELKTKFEQRRSDAVFRSDLMSRPVAFVPENLGNSVNSGADEYINALAADGSGIYFTRRTRNSKAGRDFLEDFYFAGFLADSLKPAEKLAYPPGKEDDAGGLSISADGRIMFFTCCDRADSYGSCDLYFSEKTGNSWSVAKNMGRNINSENWEAQPSVSPDGKTLYFASNRNGGQGGADIWKTDRNPDGSWAAPVNLGVPVNTSGNEMGPFIHYDNQTLYFSSSGHKGMGGADLFKSVRNGTSWQTPQNLGYPINSQADELVIVVNPEGSLGYISSFDPSNGKGYDVFSFELQEIIRPEPVTYLKGKVFDSKSYLPLEAHFALIDIIKDSVIVESESDRINGEFLVCLPGNRNYALNVTRPGYLFYSDHFPLNEIKTSLDPVLKDIPLEPIEIGNSTILRNIFYDTDQYVLKPESYPELDKLAEFLDKNPSIRIEIGGHTDDVGSDEYNAGLSNNRAKSVFDFLVQAGTASSRLTYKGYGENSPISGNDTEEGRALNRRTEITVIR